MTFIPTIAQFTPSEEQQALINTFEAQFGPLDTSEKQAILLAAVAGAGKTSSLMLLAEYLAFLQGRLNQEARAKMLKLKRFVAPRKIEACILSFNVDIKDEITEKLKQIHGTPVIAKTTNGLGMSILRNIALSGIKPDPEVDDGKYERLTKAYFMKMLDTDTEKSFKPVHWKMIGQIKRLVDFVCSTYVEPTEENLIHIVLHYNLEDIDIYDPNIWPQVRKTVPIILRAGIADYEQTGHVSFNDQIYMPLKLKLTAPIWDVIMTDECQDLNTMRLQMIKQAIKTSGQLIFVGDDFQAIQGFTGADTDALNTIIRETRAKVLPLTLCRRCDKDIIFMAQQIVPHIRPREDASQGTVKVITTEQMLAELREGIIERVKGKERSIRKADIVLCRTKAPLVRYCLALLRAGKSAMIKGREISREFTKLLSELAKIAGCELAELRMQDIEPALKTYAAKYEEKYKNLKDADIKIADLNDRIETFEAFREGYLAEIGEKATAPGLKEFIESKFKDRDKVAVQLMTIHKSKGLEADRVFIVGPDLLPHPAAKLAWQVKQEWNLLYVAITRAKHSLFFVEGVPGSLLLPPAEEIIEEAEYVAAAAERALDAAETETTQEPSQEQPKEEQNATWAISSAHRDAFKRWAETYNKISGQQLAEARVLELCLEQLPGFDLLLLKAQRERGVIEDGDENTDPKQ